MKLLTPFSSSENELALLKAWGHTTLNSVHRFCDLNNNGLPTSTHVGKSLRYGCSTLSAVRSFVVEFIFVSCFEGAVFEASCEYSITPTFRHDRHAFLSLDKHFSLINPLIGTKKLKPNEKMTSQHQQVVSIDLDARNFIRFVSAR